MVIGEGVGCGCESSSNGGGLWLWFDDIFVLNFSFLFMFEVSMQKIINKLNFYISNLVTNHLKNKQFTILIFSIMKKIKHVVCVCDTLS